MRLHRIISTAALGVALAASTAAVAGAQGASKKPHEHPAARPAQGVLPPAQGGQAAESHDVKRSVTMPANATGRCADGTWSVAASQRGACANHGGVAAWFGTKPAGATARCSDGSYYRSRVLQGACAGRGGVALRYEGKAKSKSSASAKRRE